MRIVRIDLVGTTDGNGNATIKVPLPFTGAWYDLKFPMGLSAPAEWAILVSGTPVTYGRGRRVTLGPELIQDGETVTINVTNGPPNAAIFGSANGVAGTPDEILSGYTMSPNTISTDIASLAQVLGSVTTAVIAPAVSQSFPVPRNTQAIGFAGQQPLGGSPTVTIQGDQSGIQYFAVNTAIPAGPPTGTAGQTVQATLLDPLDTSVTISIQNASSSSTVNLLAWSVMPTVFARQLTGDVFATDPINRAGRLLGQVRPQKYDGNGSNNPAPGNQATFTLGASGAGQRWVCAEVDASIFGAGGAVAAIATLVLRDGASGVGTILRVWDMGISGVGDKDHVLRSDLGIPGSLNSQMTLEFTAGVANMFQDVNIGAYLGT